MGHRQDYIVNIISEALGSGGGPEAVFEALEAKCLLPGSSSRSDANAMERRFAQHGLPSIPYGPHLRRLPKYYPLYWRIAWAMGEEYSSGLSLKNLADIHGMSFGDVHDIIVDSGVDRRRPGRQARKGK